MDIRRPFFLLIYFFFFIRCEAQQTLKFSEHTILLKKKIAFSLKIPEGYNISVAAEGLERPRFFAISPDGRLFVTDMHNRSDNNLGRVLILENWNEQQKQFEKISVYLDKLHNPNQVSFYSSNGKNYIYIAETGRLSYYEYRAGDEKPFSAGRTITVFPDYGLDYKYGGWHLTRSLAFHNNKLYVSVGSSCNACIEKEEIRATIIEMDPDGSHPLFYAKGLRNAVGIKWINDKLWVTNMGRDGLGPDKPEDLFHTVEANGYYGWPYFFQYKNKILADQQFKDSAKNRYVKEPPVAPWGFKAHSAPLGFDFFSGFKDQLLNNSFLVALHGSTSVWRQRGNSIVQLLPNGKYREIVTGFLQGKTESKRFGRPCDILQWNDHSFFISDDKNGVIYFIWKNE